MKSKYFNYIFHNPDIYQNEKIKAPFFITVALGVFLLIASLTEGMILLGAINAVLPGLVSYHFFEKLKKKPMLMSLHRYWGVSYCLIGLQFLSFAIITIGLSDFGVLTIYLACYLSLGIVTVCVYFFMAAKNIAKNKYKVSYHSFFGKYGIGAAGGAMAYLLVRVCFYVFPGLFSYRAHAVIPFLCAILMNIFFAQSSECFYKLYLQKKYQIDKELKPLT